MHPLRPLRLTKETWRVVAGWAEEWGPEHQRLAAKLLLTLMEGTWINEWKWSKGTVNPELVEIELDRQNPVYMTVYEDGGVDFANVFTHVPDPSAGEAFDTGERLGVEPEPVPGLDDEGRRPPPEPDELHAEPNETQEEYERRLRRFRRSG